MIFFLSRSASRPWIFFPYCGTQTVYETATEVQPLDSALLETSWNNLPIVQAPQNSLWRLKCIFKPAQASKCPEDYLEHDNYC